MRIRVHIRLIDVLNNVGNIGIAISIPVSKKEPGIEMKTNNCSNALKIKMVVRNGRKLSKTSKEERRMP